MLNFAHLNLWNNFQKITHISLIKIQVVHNYKCFILETKNMTALLKWLAMTIPKICWNYFNFLTLCNSTHELCLTLESCVVHRCLCNAYTSLTSASHTLTSSEYATRNGSAIVPMNIWDVIRCRWTQRWSVSLYLNARDARTVAYHQYMLYTPHQSTCRLSVLQSRDEGIFLIFFCNNLYGIAGEYRHNATTSGAPYIIC